MMNNRVIDEMFQDQAIALKQAGFGTSAFDLEANKIVEKKNNAYFIVDMPRLLDLVKARKRWNECACLQLSVKRVNSQRPLAAQKTSSLQLFRTSFAHRCNPF